MNKLRFGMAAVIAMVSVTISLVIRHDARVHSSERESLLRQQVEEIGGVAAENQRLTQIVEQAKNAQPLSREQLLELLRLRNQIRQLRQTAAEKPQIAAENAQLKTVISESQKRAGEEQAAPNYWPKEQLTFAGYADPESAMKSMLWTMKSGDLSSWQASCSPEARVKMENEWDKHKKSEAERMADMQGMADSLLSSASGFRVIDLEMKSPELAVINLSFVGEDTARKFILKKIENEWKFHDIIFAGQKTPQ